MIWGIASMQGAQSKAQKSITTTLPLSDLSVNGWLLIHAERLISRALYVPGSFAGGTANTMPQSANSVVITALVDIMLIEPRRRSGPCSRRLPAEIEPTRGRCEDGKIPNETPV